MLDYLRFDPSGCGFPRPAVPLLPAPRLADLRGDSGAGAVLSGPGVTHYARGRYALHAAYRDAGVGAAGRLLAPSYHCRTMLDPALALGADVDFYPVGAGLAPDTAAIARLLEHSDGPPVRALVLPHYFGVAQDAAVMAGLLALCSAHGATLVEDCSHAWLVGARRARERRGAHHAIVASPYKFFASEDGGVLWSDAAGGDTRSPGLVHEAKAVLAAWQRARSAASPPPLPGVLADSGLRGRDVAERGNVPSTQYQMDAARRASLALSRWVMRRASVAPIVARRRAHYAQWRAALAGVAGARVLFPEPPEDCAPYMLPLLLDDADPVFHLLKQHGMPIWRWDDMAASGCAVAQQYRTRLLHLPCHQGLSAAQMDWMMALVLKALAAGKPA